MDYLKKIAEQEYKKYKSRIASKLLEFDKSRIEYRVISLGESLIMVLKKEKASPLLLVGFPFPIQSYPLKNIKSNKSSIKVFLKGRLVAEYQRKQLIEELIKTGKDVKYNEIKTIAEFRDIVKKLFSNYRTFNYYDPYSFIGDSLLGLYFPYQISKNFNLEINKVYSENYLNVNSCIKSMGYLERGAYNESMPQVFSDLIPNQWNRTKYLVRKVSESNNPSIILGRDLVVISNSKEIEIYHYSREEVLLKEENIEDYMNKCLFPFVDKIYTSQDKLNLKLSKNLIINPFGSENLKDLPVDLIKEIIKTHLHDNPNAKILIIAGLKNNYSHLLWIAELRSFLLSSDFEARAIIKNYGSFNEILLDLKKYNVDLAITADTSLAHFFNYLNLTNLTIYNLKRCDLSSPQSLASDSPLGFCRFKRRQFPAIFNGKLSIEFIEGALGFVRYFTGHNQDKSWASKIFNKHILVRRIGSRHKDLIKANKRISPEEKIKND